MQLMKADVGLPITVQTLKWSEITGVSVDSSDNRMTIKIADAEIGLKFCSGIEQYLLKQIISNTDVITTPEPDVLPFDACLTPDVQLAIVLLVMKYKLSDNAAQDSQIEKLVSGTMHKLPAEQAQNTTAIVDDQQQESSLLRTLKNLRGRSRRE